MALRYPSSKNFADFFLMGLQLNICSKTEIIIWADRLIEATSRPSNWAIDLSTSSHKSEKDVLHILNSVPGIQDIEVSLRLLIAKLGLIKPTIYLQKDRFFPADDSKLFSRLYFIVRGHDNIPDDIQGSIFDIYINMDSIEQGYLDSFTFKRDYQILLCAGKKLSNFCSKIKIALKSTIIFNSIESNTLKRRSHC